MTSDQSDTASQEPAIPTFGTNGIESLPAFNCALVRTFSGLRGRRGTGRILVSGLTAGIAINGQAGGADFLILAEQLRKFFDAFKWNGTSSTWNVGVFSRKDGGDAFPLNPAGFHTIVRHEISPFLTSRSTRKR